MQQGLEQGIEQGIEQGKREATIKTAENLLNKGIDKNIISECTGLSTKEIDNLK